MSIITLNSTLPWAIGKFECTSKEYMQYLYYPITIPEAPTSFIEPRLIFLLDMVEAAINNIERTNPNFYTYVYLTVKQTFVPKGIDQNRPGWHSDGFGTDDVQFIWFDKDPTEFMIGNFSVRNDDALSMQDMDNWGNEIEARPDKSRGWLCRPEAGFLYRIDKNNIHRTRPASSSGVRMFVKITFSQHRYAQEGNSINYNLDYDWSFAPRAADRNQPHATK